MHVWVLTCLTHTASLIKDTHKTHQSPATLEIYARRHHSTNANTEPDQNGAGATLLLACQFYHRDLPSLTITGNFTASHKLSLNTHHVSSFVLSKKTRIQLWASLQSSRSPTLHPSITGQVWEVPEQLLPRAKLSKAKGGAMGTQRRNVQN